MPVYQELSSMQISRWKNPLTQKHPAIRDPNQIFGDPIVLTRHLQTITTDDQQELRFVDINLTFGKPDQLYFPGAEGLQLRMSLKYDNKDINQIIVELNETESSVNGNRPFNFKAIFSPEKVIFTLKGRDYDEKNTLAEHAQFVSDWGELATGCLPDLRQESLVGSILTLSQAVIKSVFTRERHFV